jgi:putative acetyltransferase
MKIIQDKLNGAEITGLLREHLENMAKHSPPESIHALGLEQLRKPDITFWSAWEGNELLGCGALKELDSWHGEIKSMRTVTHHLRKGVAAAMLLHILDEAQQRNYRRISLETGSMPAFIPAHKLYERYGFTQCGPFADYIEDPYSIFMTKEL